MQSLQVSFVFSCQIISHKLDRENNKLPKSGTGNEKAVNHLYALKTGSSNLRSHLVSKHEKVYREAIDEHGWAYDIATMTRVSGASPNPRKLRDINIPNFSPDEFLRALVRFIVADDQVSRFVIAFGQPHLTFTVHSGDRMPRVQISMFAPS